MPASMLQLSEEQIVRLWQECDIYARLAEKAAEVRCILREIPTPIHQLRLDTLKPKVHQDVFLKFNAMQGRGYVYAPCWSYYTAAVERRALQAEDNDAAFDVLRFRRQCRKEFQQLVSQREEQLQGLGLFGDWQNGSKNLAPRDEARILSMFSKLRAQGYLVKDEKLGHWCSKCHTSLSEDEIDTRSAQTHSGYVKFPVNYGLEEFGESVYILAWLEELWHLTGSVALGLAKGTRCLIIELNGEALVLTETDFYAHLPESLRAQVGMVTTCGSDTLADCVCAHPALSIDVPVVVYEQASQAAPATVRHLASGHHPHDYRIAHKLGLPVHAVVDDSGCLTEEAEKFCGLPADEAGKFIAFELEKRGYLVYDSQKATPAPHCWTCDSPALFRPLQQWIFSLDNRQLRERGLHSGQHLNSGAPEVADWLQEVVNELPDVCVSARRGWGVPIAVFQCDKCGMEISDSRVAKAIRDLVSRRGADVWFKLEAEDFLSPDIACPNCDAKIFRKESALLEARFSLVLFNAGNVPPKKSLTAPVNVFFYHPDRFQRWFAQFWLAALAIHDAPLSNVELIPVETATPLTDTGESWMEGLPGDVVRLLALDPEFNGASVASAVEQCRGDYAFVQALFAKILDYFDGCCSKLSLDVLLPVDGLALASANRLLREVDQAYEQRQFYKAWRLILGFCRRELGDIYLPTLTGRLSEAEPSFEKASGQTALCELLSVLTQRLAPVTPFLAERVQLSLEPPSKAGGIAKTPSVFLKNWVSQINILDTEDAEVQCQEFAQGRG